MAQCSALPNGTLVASLAVTRVDAASELTAVALRKFRRFMFLPANRVAGSEILPAVELRVKGQGSGNQDHFGTVDQRPDSVFGASPPIIIQILRRGRPSSHFVLDLDFDHIGFRVQVI